VFHPFFVSSDFCHHGSGGAAVDSAQSQQVQYLSPRKDFKLITCLVQESWSSKVCCQILTQQQEQQQQYAAALGVVAVAH
jgi:hypothetical protein